MYTVIATTTATRFSLSHSLLSLSEIRLTIACCKSCPDEKSTWIFFTGKCGLGSAGILGTLEFVEPCYVVVTPLSATDTFDVEQKERRTCFSY